MSRRQQATRIRPRLDVSVSRPGSAVPLHLRFSGEPPSSWRSGLEPIFVALDTTLMDQLREKAAAHGTTYDYLLKTILRDHIGEY
jgi:hypothetical protein